MPPEELKYLSTHEWCRMEGDLLIIGVTELAVNNLGEITYIDIPDVGDDVLKEVPFGEIEGTKSFKDLDSPADGCVVAVNAKLAGDPDVIINDPYGSGWLIKLKPDAPVALDNLLSASDYADLTKKRGR